MQKIGDRSAHDHPLQIIIINSRREDNKNSIAFHRGLEIRYFFTSLRVR